MAYFYGINANTASNFFSNSYSSSKEKSTSFSIYDSLGDYKSIESGAYFKLCKAYYAKVGNTSSEDESSEKSNATIGEEAVSLKEASKTLTDLSYTEENRDKITSGVQSFVEKYNSLISACDNSSTSSVQTTSNLLGKYSSANATALSNVGITVNSDNTLSVSESKLSAANLSDLESLFKGAGSYNSKVSSYATTIYTRAMMNESTYSSSGKVNSLNMSTLYNSYT